ncbi:MAG: hypothetical protein ACK5LT_09405 [Lachnospirales bacterium]
MEGLSDFSRKRESIILRIASVWNMVIGAITLFYYSSWIKGQVDLGKSITSQEIIAGRLLFEAIDNFIMMYSIALISIGAINYYLGTVKIKKGLIHKGIVIWIMVWAILSYFLVDVVGFALYFVFLINTLIRNKLIKNCNT